MIQNGGGRRFKLIQNMSILNNFVKNICIHEKDLFTLQMRTKMVILLIILCYELYFT